jgi:hypothetical protein
MRRAVIVTLATVALSAVLATPVLAAKPVVEKFEDADAFLIDCGAFTLAETLTFSGTTKTWFDANGDPIRQQTHVAFDGVISGTGGIRVLADRATVNEFVSFGADGPTTRQVGVVYNFHVPGHGVIAHDVGSITFFPDGSVEFHGPHDVFESGLESLICPFFV